MQKLIHLAVALNDPSTRLQTRFSEPQSLWKHVAVSGKVPVGNNDNSVWNYGGKQIGFAGASECLLGPWGPMGP